MATSLKAGAIIGLLLVVSPGSSLGGSTCGSSCANNNDCYESSCTRCSPQNGTCILGLPCNSICQVDTDCNTLSCPNCVSGRCHSTNGPVAPDPPVFQCKDVPCDHDNNCTSLGQGCVGCGEDHRCHTAEGFCGRLCNDDSNCAGSCPDCRDYHCRAAPVPVPVPVPVPTPAKCNAYKCNTFFDCAQHGDRSCVFCGGDSRCHTKSSICGVPCRNSTDCAGPGGSNCPRCVEGRCTGSTCGDKCTGDKGYLECNTPGCDYCNSDDTCGQGPSGCGAKCVDSSDCPYPCATCGGYPEGGHALFCRSGRNSCSAPCRDSSDCPYPCATCDEGLHICLGPNNVCGKKCETSSDCPYPCATCSQGSHTCV